MTEADRHFKETCKRILEEGYSSEGTGVRTRWEDGSEANYISIVGVQNLYDLGKEILMTNLFNHAELKDMNLEPCAYSTQWLVKGGKLHLILNQRSQDMLAANGWNTMQYAALLCMFAQVSGLEVGTLTHNIGDCHIYDRHVPLIQKLIDAEPVECSPKLVINNPTKDFYEFKVEDFEIQDYDYNKEIKLGKIPVAI